MTVFAIAENICICKSVHCMTVYKIQNVNKHLLIQQIADLDNLLSDANDVAMMIILALNYLYSDTVQILQAQ